MREISYNKARNPQWIRRQKIQRIRRADDDTYLFGHDDLEYFFVEPVGYKQEIMWGRQQHINIMSDAKNTIITNHNKKVASRRIQTKITNIMFSCLDIGGWGAYLTSICSINDTNNDWCASLSATPWRIQGDGCGIFFAKFDGLRQFVSHQSCGTVTSTVLNAWHVVIRELRRRIFFHTTHDFSLHFFQTPRHRHLNKPTTHVVLVLVPSIPWNITTVAEAACSNKSCFRSQPLRCGNPVSLVSGCIADERRESYITAVHKTKHQIPLSTKFRLPPTHTSTRWWCCCFQHARLFPCCSSLSYYPGVVVSMHSILLKFVDTSSLILSREKSFGFEELIIILVPTGGNWITIPWITWRKNIVTFGNEIWFICNDLASMPFASIPLKQNSITMPSFVP